MFINRLYPSLIKWRRKIQYLSDNCSLQVLGYIISPSRVTLFKRIFWLLPTIACCICSARVLQGALHLYITDAVSYSVETDYLEFDTPFPALTVCEEANDKNIIKLLKSSNFSSLSSAVLKDLSFWNLDYCKKCLTCEIGYSCVDDFMKLVHNIRKNCTELLTRCSWNDISFTCCERFRPIQTEYGICFVFNSRLTDNELIYTVNRKIGLSTLKFEAVEDIKLRVHSSDDMVTVATNVASEKVLSRCDVLPLRSDFDVILSAEETISDVSVQRLAPSSRDCLFEYERPDFAHLWPFKRYSYSTCLLYCRAITQAQACNCTHHFMPDIGDIPKCDIRGLICLHKNKYKLGIDHYHCPMSCDEVMYRVVYLTCPRHIGKIEDSHSHGTLGRVRLSHLPTLRVRRQAIRELLGVVVDVGGVIGVFFGASLLSFFEIFYLLFIRKYN